MFGLGPTELIIIAVIILILFGAKRIPEIGKGLGGAVREFRNIKKELRFHKTSEKDGPEQESTDEEGGSKFLETKLGEKMLDKLPGVKKAMNVKKKAEKVKKFIDQ